MYSLDELKFFRKTAVATDYVYVKIKVTMVFFIFAIYSIFALSIDFELKVEHSI